MNVLVLATRVPFSGEALADRLVRALIAAGENAEAFQLPFSAAPDVELGHMVLARQIRLLNVDHLIALDFPLALVPWHAKVVWITAGLPEGQPEAAQRLALGEARRVFTGSDALAVELRGRLGIAAEVLAEPNDAGWPAVVRRLLA